MAATVHQLRPLPASDPATDALSAFLGHLGNCALAWNTTEAYRRQAGFYVAFLGGFHGADEAFTDAVGAAAAVTAWKRHLLELGRRPASINQAMAAVELMYEVACHFEVKAKRVRVEPLGEPQALTPAEEGRLRRNADRAGKRDAAIIWLFLDTGARREELSRLRLPDVALSKNTGRVRLLGKGDQVRYIKLSTESRRRLREWLIERAAMPGAGGHDHLWVGHKGPMTFKGVEKVVGRLGEISKINSLSPHDLRHTFAVRCRQQGVDLSVLQRLMGHAHMETTARYARAGQAEVDSAIDAVFG